MSIVPPVIWKLRELLYVSKARMPLPVLRKTPLPVMIVPPCVPREAWLSGLAPVALANVCRPSRRRCRPDTGRCHRHKIPARPRYPTLRVLAVRKNPAPAEKPAWAWAVAGAAGPGVDHLERAAVTLTLPLTGCRCRTAHDARTGLRQVAAAGEAVGECLDGRVGEDQATGVDHDAARHRAVVARAVAQLQPAAADRRPPVYVFEPVRINVPAPPTERLPADAVDASAMTPA